MMWSQTYEDRIAHVATYDILTVVLNMVTVVLDMIYVLYGNHVTLWFG